MTAPYRRPSDEDTIADHQKRIIRLESVADCCETAGFEDAVLVRNRAGYWYGCGDGSAVDGSTVINYGTLGTDATFDQDDPAEAPTGPPSGTTGPDATGGWPLAQDNGSFIRGQFTGIDGFGPQGAALPGASILDVGDVSVGIDSADPFTVNGWLRFDNFARFLDAPVNDTYGDSVAFGYKQNGTARRLLIYVPGVSGPTVPDPILKAVWESGADTATLSAGLIEISEALMATVTWDPATRLFRFYVNGALVDSQTVGGTSAPTFPDLRIGAADLGPSGSPVWGKWCGALDEWGIWENEALSPGDVALLYFAGTPPPPTTASEIASFGATCGEPLCADGTGGATWGNPCAATGVYVMPATPTAQDVVDALIALGLVTQ